MITFGSLFTGIGGFDLAFTRAGMKCLWECEIDKNARFVLNKHSGELGNPEIHEDVRKIGKENLKPVDLICGGFPCQDLSVAGKRKGLAGERSGLWFEFARIIDQLEPRWVVIENVPGLLSSGGGKDFEVIIRWLAERGYGVAWRVLDAQYFGVPQRRRRVLIVASFGSGNCAKVLFEPESLQGDHPESQKAGQGVAFTFRTGTSSSSGKGDGGLNINLITDTLTTNGDSHSGFRNGEWIVVGTIDQKCSSAHRGSQGNETEFLVAGTVTSKWAKGAGGPAGDETYNLVTQTFQNTGRGYWQNNEIGTTVRTPEGGGSLEENLVCAPCVGVRRLTPLECERLQGFPDNWTAGQSDAARYKQCGNAVAVPVFEWTGKRIVEVEDAAIR